MESASLFLPSPSSRSPFGVSERGSEGGTEFVWAELRRARRGQEREREREQAGERVGKLEEKEGNDGRTAEEGRKHQHYEEEEGEEEMERGATTKDRRTDGQ